MNRAFQFSVIASIALSSSLLFAQPPGRGGPPGMREGGGPPIEMIIQLFTLADVNSDGCVTRAELTTVLQNQSRGNQFGRGGPPPQAGNFGQANQQAPNQPPQDGGAQGSSPTPGQVLPEPVAQSLNLNDRQKRQLAALQAEVDKRLAAMLTDEQEEQLKNYQPPQGPDHVEAEADHGEAGVDNGDDGLPQGPQ